MRQAGVPVAVVMALYRPDRARLERQVDSIRRQCGVDVRLFLFADGPMDGLDEVAALYADDPSITLVRFPANRGPATTFLEGMTHVLATEWAQVHSPHVAFSDQDDEWDADKLILTIARLAETGASAAHCDARLVDGEGRLLAPSMFDFEQRERAPSLLRLFLRNNVTGMTMVLTNHAARAGSALRASRPGNWLHDHYLAVMAQTMAGTVLVERSLVSYVQHGGNVVGAFRPRRRSEKLRNFARHLIRPDARSREYVSGGRAFIRALLESGYPSAERRGELEELDTVLNARGMKGLAATLRLFAMVRVSNSVANRLMFEMLVP